MKKSLKLGICVSLFFFALSSPSLTQKDSLFPFEKFHKKTRIQRSFIQNKHLKDLDITLESKGELLIERSKERITWKTTSPYSTTISITPRGVEMIDKTGSHSLPAGSDKFKSLFSLLSFDMELWKNNFHIEAQGKGKYRLMPRNEKGFFKECLIHLDQKNAELKNISILENTGDQLEIRFL